MTGDQGHKDMKGTTPVPESYWATGLSHKMLGCRRKNHKSVANSQRCAYGREEGAFDGFTLIIVGGFSTSGIASRSF